MKCTEEYPSRHFNEHIIKFLSPTFPSYKIKRVSCSEGFFLTGTLSFKDGKKLNAVNLEANQNLQINNQSPIKIALPSEAGNPYEMEVYFQGEVNGNKVHLIFEDSEGKIVLKGEIGPNDEGNLVFFRTFFLFHPPPQESPSFAHSLPWRTKTHPGN